MLTRIQEAGLKVKQKKFQFGRVIGSGKVYPENAKVKAIHEFKVPATKKDVRSFLGLSRYYRQFVPDCSSIATPLTDLTQKTKPIKLWLCGPECDSAFKQQDR